jgi:hypothetical protein
MKLRDPIYLVAAYMPRSIVTIRRTPRPTYPKFRDSRPPSSINQYLHSSSSFPHSSSSSIAPPPLFTVTATITVILCGIPLSKLVILSATSMITTSTALLVRVPLRLGRRRIWNRTRNTLPHLSIRILLPLRILPYPVPRHWQHRYKQRRQNHPGLYPWATGDPEFIL